MPNSVSLKKHFINVFDYHKYMPKDIFKKILAEWQDSPTRALITRDTQIKSSNEIISAIIGPRRVGKTSLMLINAQKQEKEKTIFIDFEDNRLANLKTEELDEMEFYAPKLNLSAEAYLVDGTNSNLLDLTFGYYDTFTGGTEHPFCNVTINVTSDNAEIYFGICNGGPANSLEAFYYSIHNMGTNDVKIKVTTHYQNTMVKVLGVAN